MKQIKLTQGFYAYVDDYNYDFLNQYKWYYNKKYAIRNSSKILGKQRKIQMHHLVLQPPKGFLIDHINGDTLDNRRINLRICKNFQNVRNSKMYKTNISGYKGVCWSKKQQKWKAQIHVNKKQIYLGSFDDIKEAAKAYDTAAKKYFGKFAGKNI